jgi:Na+-driven multidrug efflux pump
MFQVRRCMTTTQIVQMTFFLGYKPGIARGSGLQKAGAVVNLGSCYFIGIPAAIIFAFVLHIGVKVTKINVKTN